MIKKKFIPIGARACKEVEFLYSESDDENEKAQQSVNN
jgi:hypothetical protein